MLQNTICTRTKDHIKRSKVDDEIIVGFHHGVLNPLPSSWRYPPKINVIQMIYLLSLSDRVQSWGCTSSQITEQHTSDSFWLGRRDAFVNVLACESSEVLCYNPRGMSAPKFVMFFEWCDCYTALGWCVWWFSSILKTETRKANTPSLYHKSHTGAFSWRTCHDKMKDKGLFTLLNVQIFQVAFFLHELIVW